MTASGYFAIMRRLLTQEHIAEGVHTFHARIGVTPRWWVLQHLSKPVVSEQQLQGLFFEHSLTRKVS